MKITAKYFNSLLFLAYFMNKAMVYAHQIHNEDTTLADGINYLVRKDPYQPGVSFNSTSFDAQVFFVAQALTQDFILSGTHIVANSGSVDMFKTGFEWKNFIKVVDRSLGIIPKNPVNFSLAPCLANFAHHVLYQSAVWGFEGDDCLTYQQNYEKRGNHLLTKYNKKNADTAITLSVMMGVMGFFLFLLIFKSAKKNLAGCLPNFSIRGLHSTRNPLIFSAAADGMRIVEMDTLQIAEVTEPKLSDTQGIPALLKRYIKSIEANGDLRVSSLTGDEIRDCIKKYENHENNTLLCPISKRLIDIPVMMNGRTCDLRSLVDLPIDKRIDPFERDEDEKPIHFTLDQIQPDHRTNHVLRQEIQTIIENRAKISEKLAVSMV